MVGERLRQAAAELASEWARERWARHRGEGARGLASVLGQNSIAMDRDAYEEAKVERERQTAGTEEARRVKRLEAFCAEALLEGRTASVADDLFSEEIAAAARVEGEAIGYRELPSRIANEPLRERRAAIAREYVALAPQFERAQRRIADMKNELARSMGSPGASALVAAAEGFDLGRLVQDARATLDATADPFKDLSSFLRRREVGSPPSKSKPEWHDLVRALRVTSQDGHFISGRAVEFADGALREVGLGTGCERITWDAEPGGRRDNGAVVAPIGPPFDVAVSVRLVGGAPDCVNVLRAAGEALAFTLVDPDRDAGERRLLNPAWIAAMGQILVRILGEPLWHRRALRAASTLAIEGARACAVNLLYELRLDCAGVILGAAVGESGADRSVRERHEDLMEKVTFSRWPSVWWIRDASRFVEASANLRGAAIGGERVVLLRERFNEDWWRNPGAGKFLAAECAQAASLDVDTLAAGTESGNARSGLQRAAEQLVAAATI
jgi:hypothetical protein